MSKQKRGMFRRLVDAGRQAIGLPVTHHYPDPVLRDRRRVPTRKKSHSRGRHKRRVKEAAHRALPCEPGTIVYFDKLVRHFGRRRADGYHECLQRKMMHALPTEQDFADNPPWAHLK